MLVPNRRLVRRTAAASAALVASLTLALPGVAGATTSQTGEELGPRLERACLRIPNLEIWTTEVLDRLDGDETVKGSLAWVQTKIDEADEQGRVQLVTVLENRLEVRTASVEVLETRLDELAEARQLCADNGVEL